MQLLERLASLGGKHYIIKEPSDREAGIIVLDGELLYLEFGKGAGIRIREEKKDITADGVVYSGARILRTAYYVPEYTKDVPGLYQAAGITKVSSNDQLAKKISDIVTLRSDIAERLLVITSKSLTRTQLNAQKNNCRICCRKGCVPLNGAEEYTINVYRHSDDNITQEQILPDSRKFVRYWNAAANKWTAFVIADDTLHLDFKIVKGSTVYVRHGYIPDNMKLVLLRKKKRTGKRRTGGAKTKNSIYRGKTVFRQPKNQYVHYRGVVLSTSIPGRWYVPKCIGVSDKSDNKLIGKELGSVCAELVVPLNNGIYRISGTRINLAPSSMGCKDTVGTGYARIALQIAEAGKTFKSAGGEMVRLKYRIWFETKNRTIMRRGFSVD